MLHYSLSRIHGRMFHPIGLEQIPVGVNGKELDAEIHEWFLCKNSTRLPLSTTSNFHTCMVDVIFLNFSEHYQVWVWAVSYLETFKDYLNCRLCRSSFTFPVSPALPLLSDELWSLYSKYWLHFIGIYHTTRSWQDLFLSLLENWQSYQICKWIWIIVPFIYPLISWLYADFFLNFMTGSLLVVGFLDQYQIPLDLSPSWFFCKYSTLFTLNGGPVRDIFYQDAKKFTHLFGLSCLHCTEYDGSGNWCLYQLKLWFF